MTTQTTGPAQLRGDEEQLFQQHRHDLWRAVRKRVNTSEANVDDACAIAWMALVRSQPRRETVFGWLRTVAIHEAIRLDRSQRRCVAAELDGVEHPALHDRSADLDIRLEAREALRALGALRERQRVILGYKVLGFRYAEIAQITGDTPLTVERQLRRARKAIRTRRSADDQ